MIKTVAVIIFSVFLCGIANAQDSYKEVASQIFRSTKLTVTKGNQQKDYHIESPFFNLQVKIYNDSFFLGKIKSIYENHNKQLNGKIIKDCNQKYDSDIVFKECFNVIKKGENSFKLRYSHCDESNLLVWISIVNDSIREFHQWSSSDFNNVSIYFKDTSSFHQMNMDGFDKTYFFNRRLQMLYSWEFVAVPYFDEAQSKLLNRYYDVKKDTTGKILEINQSKELEWYDYIGTKKISMSKSVKDGEQYKLDAADKTRYYLEIWKDDKKVK